MTKRIYVVRMLEQAGFVNMGGRNHDKFVHPDGRVTFLKRHAEIENSTLRYIKKEAGLQ